MPQQQKPPMTLEAIVSALAEMNPDAPSEIDGDVSCFFCGAYLVPHHDDCIWKAAQHFK